MRNRETEKQRLRNRDGETDIEKQRWRNRKMKNRCGETERWGTEMEKREIEKHRDGDTERWRNREVEKHRET